MKHKLYQYFKIFMITICSIVAVFHAVDYVKTYHKIDHPDDPKILEGLKVYQELSVSEKLGKVLDMVWDKDKTKHNVWKAYYDYKLGLELSMAKDHIRILWSLILGYFFFCSYRRNREKLC